MSIARRIERVASALPRAESVSAVAITMSAQSDLEIVVETRCRTEEDRTLSVQIVPPGVVVRRYQLHMRGAAFLSMDHSWVERP